MAFCLPRRGLLAAGLFLAGCYSPTLPLPPPGEPEMTSIAGSDHYRFTGHVEPNAEVIALNRHTELLYGQLTGGDGRYDFEVIGEPDDQVQFWYIVGDDTSPSVVVLLPAATP